MTYLQLSLPSYATPPGISVPPPSASAQRIPVSTTNFGTPLEPHAAPQSATPRGPRILPVPVLTPPVLQPPAENIVVLPKNSKRRRAVNYSSDDLPSSGVEGPDTRIQLPKRRVISITPNKSIGRSKESITQATAPESANTRGHGELEPGEVRNLEAGQFPMNGLNTSRGFIQPTEEAVNHASKMAWEKVAKFYKIQNELIKAHEDLKKDPKNRDLIANRRRIMQALSGLQRRMRQMNEQIIGERTNPPPLTYEPHKEDEGSGDETLAERYDRDQELLNSRSDGSGATRARIRGDAGSREETIAERYDREQGIVNNQPGGSGVTRAQFTPPDISDDDLPLTQRFPRTGGVSRTDISDDDLPLTQRFPRTGGVSRTQREAISDETLPHLTADDLDQVYKPRKKALKRLGKTSNPTTPASKRGTTREKVLRRQKVAKSKEAEDKKKAQGKKKGNWRNLIRGDNSDPSDDDDTVNLPNKRGASIRKKTTLKTKHIKKKGKKD